MGYILSRKAEDDIISIFHVGAELFGIRQAEQYHENLEKTFQFLADNPLAAPQRLEITPPVRIHPTGSYLIIYTINSDADIFIVRVRHGHEDWQGVQDTP